MNSRDAEASAQEKEQAAGFAFFSRPFCPRTFAAVRPQAMRDFLNQQEAAKDEVVTVNYTYRSEVLRGPATAASLPLPCWLSGHLAAVLLTGHSARDSKWRAQRHD